MNLTINVPDDLMSSLKSKALAEDRSVSRHVLSLIRKDVAPPAPVTSGRRLSAKDQEVADYRAKPVIDRPFVRHLVSHRGYALEALQSLTKEAVHRIYVDFLLPGGYPMSDSERFVDQAEFNASTGQNPNSGRPQPPITAPGPDEEDGIDFED